MTSISSSSYLSSLSSLSTGAQSTGRVPGHVAAAAKALGMSAGDVMTALKSGESLADLASQQGVSRDDLASALKASAPDDLRNSGQLDAVTDQLIDQSGLAAPGGPAGAGAPPKPSAATTSASTGVLGSSLTDDQKNTLSALSSLLGTDAGSLLSQLQSGASLTDLLDSAGLTSDAMTSSSDTRQGFLIDTRA